MLKQLSVVLSPFAHRSRYASIAQRSILLLVITLICGCQLWGGSYGSIIQTSINGNRFIDSPKPVSFQRCMAMWNLHSVTAWW